MAKTVLITGSSTGFGRLMVTEFLAAGWDVIASLRDAEGRKELYAAELAQHGDRLSLISLDVADAAQRQAVADTLRAKGAGLDALINNAGYGLFGALEDLGEAQLRHQLEVNFFGAVLLTRDLLPLLRERRGVVVNVSSVLGYFGFPLASAYCASKSALGGFSEALHHELAPHGVRVLLVEPGGHRTSFGHNLVWAEGTSEVYAVQSKNYLRLRQKLAAGRGTRPEPLARKVVRLVDRPRRKLRLRVGLGAVCADLFKRLAPERLRLIVLGVLFRRLFLARTAS